MMKKFIALTCAALLALATPALAANDPLGTAIDQLAQPSPATPQSGDKIPVQRGGSLNGFYLPGNSYLIPGNNLSDVTNKANSRFNLGYGSVSAGTGNVSIMDYGADPTGGGSSDTAFTSCITSGKNCYVPPGTYLISCTNHNATNNIILYGDDAKSATLKLPAGCTMPTTGVINLANIENITIDVNNNTVGTCPAAPAPCPRIVSNFVTGGAVNVAPFYQNMQIINANTNMYLIFISAPTVNVVNPIVRNNILKLTAPASGTPNECVLFTNGVSTFVTGGQITDNICVNTGMNGSIQGAYFTNNDISGWGYGAGIQIAQTLVSLNNHVLNNRIYNSGTANDLNGSPANGIVNFGKNSEISGNIIRQVGGACIDNGGQNSIIIGNYCLDAENRADGQGDAAFFVFNFDTTFNGNGSSWIGNYATDDRGAGAKVLVGYQDSTGNANVFLSGNVFSGIATPYFLQ